MPGVHSGRGLIRLLLVPGLFLALAITLATGSGAAWAAGPANAAQFFKGIQGCALVYNLSDQSWVLRHNPELAGRRFSPCSTFKIPHTLIALQTGVLSGPDALKKWDGTPQPLPAWQRDHALASAVRYSVVWYFRRVARAVGRARMQRWLDALDYGNRDLTGPLDGFWLSNSLKISPDEQVAFLNRLYQGRLPVRPGVQEAVRRIIRLASGPGWVLSGKTGSGVMGDKSTLGWFVGHLKAADGKQYTFAVLARGRDGADGRRAKSAAKGILGQLGLIKAE